MAEVLRIVLLAPETANHKAAGMDSLPQLVHALFLRHSDQLRHVVPRVSPHAHPRTHIGNAARR